MVLRETAHKHGFSEGDEINLEIDAYFNSAKEFQKAIKKLDSFFTKSSKTGNFSFLNKKKFSIKIHKVKKGESVWSIARKYGLRPSQIIENNFKVRRRPLYIGENLIIPKGSRTKAPAKAEKIVYHKVAKGETLYGIARKYKVSLSYLQKTNKIKEGAILKPGKKLKIMKGGLPTPKGYRQEKLFQWPLQGKITSGFGFRSNPFSRSRTSFHKGVDIAAKAGTPIRAVETGVVMRSKRVRGYGNCIFLLHPQNYISVYAHNSRNFAKTGQLVSKGKVIALVGRSGSATGPHLHFEIRKLKRPINPLKAMKITRLVKDS